MTLHNTLSKDINITCFRQGKEQHLPESHSPAMLSMAQINDVAVCTDKYSKVFNQLSLRKYGIFLAVEFTNKEETQPVIPHQVEPLFSSIP